MAEEKHTVADKCHLLAEITNLETERVNQVAMLKRQNALNKEDK